MEGFQGRKFFAREPMFLSAAAGGVFFSRRGKSPPAEF